MTPAINIENLVKRFPKTGGYRDILTFWRRPYFTALQGASFQAPRGEIFGLLGPNGAGKTTLLKILAGLVLPDEGRVEINGISLAEAPNQVKRHLTYVSPEERSLNWRLTGRENLTFYAFLYEVPRRRIKLRVQELLSVVGLENASDEPVGKYSSGMKQRLSIARGLLADPEILLLDEPTRSLDPVGARQIWKFIQEDLVIKQGRTILLATHNMEEATTVCQRVAILYQGQVKVCETVSNVTVRLNGQSRYHFSVLDLPSDKIGQLQQLSGVHAIAISPPNGHQYASLEVTLEEPEHHIPLMVEQLVNSGARVLEVKAVQTSLGDTIAAMTEEGG